MPGLAPNVTWLAPMRQAAHDDRNEASKLTPAERREKKLRKMFGAAALEAGLVAPGGKGPKGAAAMPAASAAPGVDLVAAVFRVGRLTSAQHRFKVDANAKENHMTGAAMSNAEPSRCLRRCELHELRLLLNDGLIPDLQASRSLRMISAWWSWRVSRRPSSGGFSGAVRAQLGDELSMADRVVSCGPSANSSSSHGPGT